MIFLKEDNESCKNVNQCHNFYPVQDTTISPCLEVIRIKKLRNFLFFKIQVPFLCLICKINLKYYKFSLYSCLATFLYIFYVVL